jgi:hypothetical protein
MFQLCNPVDVPEISPVESVGSFVIPELKISDMYDDIANYSTAPQAQAMKT